MFKDKKVTYLPTKTNHSQPTTFKDDFAWRHAISKLADELLSGKSCKVGNKEYSLADIADGSEFLHKKMSHNLVQFLSAFDESEHKQEVDLAYYDALDYFNATRQLVREFAASILEQHRSADETFNIDELAKQY